MAVRHRSSRSSELTQPGSQPTPTLVNVMSGIASGLPTLGKSIAPTTSTATVSTFVLTTHTTASAAAPSLQLQQWVSSGGASKAGSIQYLAPDLTTVLCVATLTSLSATKFTTNNSGQIHTADVELKAGAVRLSCPGI